MDINIAANSTVDSTSSYGILALNFGGGNISVTTSAGDIINSGSAGIDAVNEATSAAAGSTIVVNASGTINSGANATGTGKPPAGILAGYLDGTTNPTTFPGTGLYGDVVVNSSANITACRRRRNSRLRLWYRRRHPWISPAERSSRWAGRPPVNGYGNGIAATNNGPGDISVVTGTGTLIQSGSSGIFANNGGPDKLFHQRCFGAGLRDHRIRSHPLS